jgi:hypothetical protein
LPHIMRRIRSLVRLVAFLALGAAPALAQSTGPEDLRALPAERQVTAVAYCAGLYRVRLADGVEREFKEYDLSFKTDTTALGPPAGKPALVPAGRLGDRAIVVFGRLEEMRTLVIPRC